MRFKRDRIKMRIAYSKFMIWMYKNFKLGFLQSHLTSYTIKTTKMINSLAEITE